MKLLIETAWALVGFAAFLLSLYALRKLGAPVQAGGYVMLGLVGLLCVTWFTHWKG